MYVTIEDEALMLGKPFKKMVEFSVNCFANYEHVLFDHHDKFMKERSERIQRNRAMHLCANYITAHPILRCKQLFDVLFAKSINFCLIETLNISATSTLRP